MYEMPWNCVHAVYKDPLAFVYFVLIAKSAGVSKKKAQSCIQDLFRTLFRLSHHFFPYL